MPISSSLRPFVTRAIGAFLNGNDKIEGLVYEATGENPYNIWTNDRLPFRDQISDILSGLEKTKAERWLLTYVLIAVLENEGEHDTLRELIVRACPETLIIAAQVEEQVKRVLDDLGKLLPQPLPPTLREDLGPKQARLREIVQEIVQETARLFAYKSLHESLHSLQLKLKFGQLLGETVGADTDAHVAIGNACALASEAAKLLGAGSDDEKTEQAWIAALGSLGRRLEAAEAGDHSVEQELIGQVCAFIQLHLIRLNGCVFGAARDLSWPAIVEDPPLGFMTRPEFIDLEFAVRDLKPTVLARALKHRMWQDAEKELPLLDALLDLPGPATTQTVHQWLRFKSRILWLAELDPNTGWSADAQTLADQISDAMAAAEKSNSIKAPRENYRKLIALCFFAIDAMLKADCANLRKVDEPLNSLLQELSRV